jgi:small subunit ribosomal protein S17e
MIAGYVTHLMKRIQKGPVHGISFKLQEEERERKDNYVPETSAVDTDLIEIDNETKAMLRHLDFANLPGVQVVSLQPLGGGQVQRGGNAPRNNRQ